jgi:hypothetical protein
VSQHVDDPTCWVLHEAYDAPEFHATHRQLPHFLAYDAFVRDADGEDGVAMRRQARYLSTSNDSAPVVTIYQAREMRR